MSIGREATEIGSVVYEIECRNIGKGRGMKVIIEGQETKDFLTFSRMRKTKIIAVARRTSTKREKIEGNRFRRVSKPERIFFHAEKRSQWAIEYGAVPCLG